MRPNSEALARHIGAAGEGGIEFWYPSPEMLPMHREADLVPLFIAHAETFGREFWPSWN